jgi:hypothetical protein
MSRSRNIEIGRQVEDYLNRAAADDSQLGYIDGVEIGDGLFRILIRDARTEAVLLAMKECSKVNPLPRGTELIIGNRRNYLND